MNTQQIKEAIDKIDTYNGVADYEDKMGALVSELAKRVLALEDKLDDTNGH